MKNVLNVNARFAGVMKLMVEPIPEEQMCEQLPGLPNHPMWQVGHLTIVRTAALKAMGTAAQGIPEGWGELFRRGSTPVGDRSKYPTKAEILAAFDRMQGEVAAAVGKLTPEQLAGPHPVENFRKELPTLADLLTLMLVGHDGFHIGQLGDWRRAKGYPRIM